MPEPPRLEPQRADPQRAVPQPAPIRNTNFKVGDCVRQDDRVLCLRKNAY